MSKLSDEDLVRSFEDRLRGWGRSPAAIPAPVARTRVLARLPEPSRPVPWMRLAAAAALVVMLAVAVWRGSPRPAGEASARADIATQAPVDPDVVVWVVDAHTTVYFILSPVGSEHGGVS